jgi:serine/threonine protein kinase
MWSFQADLDSIDLWLWPLRESGEQLRVALSNIIEQMMAKDPRQRLSAEEITLDLLLTPESSDTFYGACCKPGTMTLVKKNRLVINEYPCRDY